MARFFARSFVGLSAPIITTPVDAEQVDRTEDRSDS